MCLQAKSLKDTEKQRPSSLKQTKYKYLFAISVELYTKYKNFHEVEGLKSAKFYKIPRLFSTL